MPNKYETPPCIPKPKHDRDRKAIRALELQLLKFRVAIGKMIVKEKDPEFHALQLRLYDEAVDMLRIVKARLRMGASRAAATVESEVEEEEDGETEEEDGEGEDSEDEEWDEELDEEEEEVVVTAKRKLRR